MSNLDKSKEELLAEIETLKKEKDALRAMYEKEINYLKKAEKFHIQNEKKYKLLAENIIDVIWVLDVATQKLSYVSPSVINLTGFTPEEAMTATITDALVTESAEMVFSEIPVRLAKFFSGDNSANTKVYEWQQYCKDGSVIWVEITTTFILNNEGTGVDIIGVSRNIEARKQIEKMVIEKTKELESLNITKDKFFSIIAHDLRGPFAGFLTLTKMFADEDQLINEQERKSLGEKMHKAADNLYKLLENLLEWARMQRGVVEFKPEVCIFIYLIEKNIDILSEQAAQKDIKIINNVPVDTLLLSDLAMTDTILRNLMSNAIKFTPKGGTIEIGVANSIDDPCVTIFIQDTGIGIKPELLTKLFKIDQKVSRPGTEGETSTGLGLLLCKEFVEKHEGKIWVESETGKGSTFYFCLPRA